MQAASSRARRFSTQARYCECWASAVLSWPVRSLAATMAQTNSSKACGCRRIAKDSGWPCSTLAITASSAVRTAALPSFSRSVFSASSRAMPASSSTASSLAEQAQREALAPARPGIRARPGRQFLHGQHVLRRDAQHAGDRLAVRRFDDLRPDRSFRAEDPGLVAGHRAGYQLTRSASSPLAPGAPVASEGEQVVLAMFAGRTVLVVVVPGILGQGFGEIGAGPSAPRRPAW